jgi:hypothetical protein
VKTLLALAFAVAAVGVYAWVVYDDEVLKPRAKYHGYLR